MGSGVIGLICKVCTWARGVGVMRVDGSGVPMCVLCGGVARACTLSCVTCMWHGMAVQPHMLNVWGVYACLQV